ncbi:GIY-YIG nuclease family protein [Rhizobium phaseoli]|uniref:GIY-YIG nuclease family protein n=1 Tax=Rhizobium phaseoli TaxID=396 RepID=UPI0025549A15|nr:GIY-YIG nuclease family protein [Rhizobium phaseoli]MDK4729345.1 GIY-YIG nuclease family protein [Rhizobium phaseoli]
MTEKLGAIYGIRLKDTEAVIYVGQTRRAPEHRWRQHMTGKTPISIALQMFDAKEVFEFFVIERVPVSQLNTREGYWISELQTFYPSGLNHRKGGSGKQYSTATCAKIAETTRQRYADPDQRAKTSARLRDVWANPEYRAFMIESMKVARSDPEYRAKQSVRCTKVWADNDLRAKLSARKKAMWADPEYRARHAAAIAASKKALWANPDYRAEKGPSMARTRKAV